MCNVPPKFYRVCRLCLSCPEEKTDGEDAADRLRRIFDGERTPEREDIPRKIMTCLSITVGDSRGSRFAINLKFALSSSPATAAPFFCSATISSVGHGPRPPSSQLRSITAFYFG